MPTAQCSIAVVDDDLAFAETLAAFSRLTGCRAEVVEPRGTFDVVGRIVEMNPDLVFVDVALAHFDGCDVAAELKARRSQARLIAITGDWRPETAARCRESGFEHVWRKPIDPAQVEEFLDAFMTARPAVS